MSETLYGNCKLLHPDGEMLCYTSRRKLEWYIERGLGHWVAEDPPTVQLLFEPNGYGNRGNPYYMQQWRNMCVVCGTPHMLTKHHCIPQCFRKFFPVEMKSHSSHDVLLVCRSCHDEYEKQSNKFKEELAKRYQLEINHAPVTGKMIKFASALKRHRNKMPAERVKKVEAALKEYLQVDELTDEAIETFLQTNITNFGEAIVEAVDDLEAFEQEWRKHFMLYAQPQYMPPNWGKGYHRRKHQYDVDDDMDDEWWLLEY